jgi:hypothetical protein
MLSKKSSKKEVLDMYASAIQKERVKLANIKKKRRTCAQASAQSSDSNSSDSDVSVGVIDSDNGKKRLDVDLPNGKKRSKAKTKKSSSQLNRPSGKLAKQTQLKPWTKKKPTRKPSSGLKTTAILTLTKISTHLRTRPEGHPWE